MSSGGREKFAVAMVAGAIGLAGGLGGAWIGANAATNNQRDQAKEARQAEARQKRADVYSDFLDAAVKYATTTRQIQAKIRAAPVYKPGRTLYICGNPSFQRCTDLDRELPRYLSARSRFQGALNDVYVYGSNPGVELAREMAGALPASLNTPKNGFPIGRVKEEKLSRTYSRILDRMCAEVRSDPRPTCHR
jgi:hypothetical protein